MIIDEATKARFWSKVNKTETCWLWMASTDNRGYGQIGGANRKTLSAHRVSWMLNFGNIPDGLCVLHACDIPVCVRPDHLWLGTIADNNRDMVEKGRMASGGRNGSQTYPEHRPHGERNGSAKLTDQHVRDIRERYAHGGVTQDTLAAEYEISQSACSLLILRQTWRHVQ